MSQRIDATFINGVFRPDAPVEMVDGQRVSLNVESQFVQTDDLADVRDLLDSETTLTCGQRACAAPLLEETRKILSAFHGSLAQRISEERDER